MIQTDQVSTVNFGLASRSKQERRDVRVVEHIITPRFNSLLSHTFNIVTLPANVRIVHE